MSSLSYYQPEQLVEVLQSLASDGACIIENLLTDSVCKALMSDFDSHLADIEAGVDELGYRNDFYGKQTKRLHGLFSKSGHMVDVLTHPVLIELSKRLFIETKMASEVRLSNTELMVLESGQANQDFHADAVSWRRIMAMEPAEILISANYALTEFTSTNGATRVVPGSHKWEAGRLPTDDEICLAEMSSGSALIYSGNVLHSGGANQEAKRRIGLYLGYIPSFLRPIENQLVTNNPDDVFALPEDAQRLLDVSPGGFTVYA